MTLDDLKNALPDYAKDIKLNLGSVLTPEGAPGLTPTQLWGCAVASALTARNPKVADAVLAAATQHLDPAQLTAAKTAAALMGMTNIYYRFTYLTGDPEYKTLPAKLRMNGIVTHGAPKVDFELWSLAASVVTGCATCVEAHEKTVRQHDITREGVQSAARIASVIHAAAVALEAGA
jgi:alkyl hydroperoxide reductase subunit D